MTWTRTSTLASKGICRDPNPTSSSSYPENIMDIFVCCLSVDHSCGIHCKVIVCISVKVTLCAGHMLIVVCRLG